MPERDIGKKYPYCQISVDGGCAAVNANSWADYIAKLGQDALDNGNTNKAEELFKSADQKRSEIKYCNNCPLRIK